MGCGVAAPHRKRSLPSRAPIFRRSRFGLSGAATSLGVNHSTVARRLAALEEVLRVSLFDRRRTGYRPPEQARMPATRAALEFAGGRGASAQSSLFAVFEFEMARHSE